MQIDISLHIGCLLCLTVQSNCLFDDFRKALAFSCGRIDNRAAQHLLKGSDINGSLFFLVDIRLVQSDNNWDTQFQQLSSKEKFVYSLLMGYSLRPTVTPPQLPTFSLLPVRSLYIVVLPLFGLPAKAILIQNLL